MRRRECGHYQGTCGISLQDLKFHLPESIFGTPIWLTSEISLLTEVISILIAKSSYHCYHLLFKPRRSQIYEKASKFWTQRHKHKRKEQAKLYSFLSIDKTMKQSPHFLKFWCISRDQYFCLKFISYCAIKQLITLHHFYADDN